MKMMGTDTKFLVSGWTGCTSSSASTLMPPTSAPANVSRWMQATPAPSGPKTLMNRLPTSRLVAAATTVWSTCRHSSSVRGASDRSRFSLSMFASRVSLPTPNPFAAGRGDTAVPLAACLGARKLVTPRGRVPNPAAPGRSSNASPFADLTIGPVQQVDYLLVGCLFKRVVPGADGKERLRSLQDY